jgi:polyvinyl alcohol dehydrogenase (cytochrome)
MGRVTSWRSMRAFLLAAFAVTALLGGAAVFLASGAQFALGAVAPPTQGQMLGNQRANLTTAISSKNVGHMHRIWFKQTKDAVTGTPLVWRGSVVFADWSGMVWRVRASNGSVIWKRHLGKVEKSWPWHGFAGTGAIFAQDGILVEASVEGTAWGIDLRSGKVLWTTKLSSNKYEGNISDLMAYEGKHVAYVGMSSVDEPLSQAVPGFIVDARGSVIALDAMTGKLAWQTYMVEPPATGGAVWSSFALDPAAGTLYCDTGNNYTGSPTELTDAMLALDADTGAIRWHVQVTQNDVWIPTLPFGPDFDFGGGAQLVAVGSGASARTLVCGGQKSGVYWAFDAATGTIAWHTQVGTGPEGQRGEASIANGVIYDWGDVRWDDSLPPSQFPMMVAALDAATGAVIWHKQVQPANVASAGFLANDVYFVGDAAGTIKAYRGSDGKVLWTGKTPKRASVGSSLWAQGRFLYAGTNVPGIGRQGPTGLVAYAVNH